jgi:hypothetical protein
MELGPRASELTPSSARNASVDNVNVEPISDGILPKDAGAENGIAKLAGAEKALLATVKLTSEDKRDELEEKMKQYDKNGDGWYSKAEVRLIVTDLREAQKNFRLMAKVAVGLLVLTALALASIFAVVACSADRTSEYYCCCHLEMSLVGSLPRCLTPWVRSALQVVIGNELTKEDRVDGDAVLTGSNGQGAVQTEAASSLSSLWDAPALAPALLSELTMLSVAVNMSSVASVGRWVEASFKIGSSWQPGDTDDELFLSTVEGYMIYIQNSTSTAHITMPLLGPTPLPIADALPEEPSAERLRRRLQPLIAAAAVEPNGEVTVDVPGMLFSRKEWHEHRHRDETAALAAMESGDEATPDGEEHDAERRGLRGRSSRSSRGSSRRSTASYSTSVTTVRSYSSPQFARRTRRDLRPSPPPLCPD